MRALILTIMLTATLLSPHLLVDTSAHSEFEESASIFVRPIPGLPRDFIRGVDASEAPWILELGGKYFDSGVEKHPLDILAEHGVNWIRLRVWNDPYTPEGIPYGGGNCDPERITRFAVEVKRRGLKLLVNFHYSDWWADPGRQSKPKAWANLSFTELVRAIYEWTYNTLNYMKSMGATPDIVQVGNEVNNGFLWPEGSTSNWEGFTVLLKSAIRAVRDASPETKVAIHLAGVEVEFYEYFLSKLAASGVEFDIIGISYYPYYHGSLSRLRELLRALSRRYPDKEIVILETAYAWTLSDADGHPNIFGLREHEITGGYKASIQGQASYLRDLVELVYTETSGRGRGVFYFGATWIPVKGAGWKTGEGNPWENQALFDFNGNALPSLRVFKLIYEGEHFEPKPLVLYEERPLVVTTLVNTKPALPSTVLVVFTDHSIRPLAVKWPETPLYSTPGVYELRGIVENTGFQVTVLIIVKEGSATTTTSSLSGESSTAPSVVEKKPASTVLAGAVILLVAVLAWLIFRSSRVSRVAK